VEKSENAARKRAINARVHQAEAQVQQAGAEVQQAQAEHTAQPSDMLRLERLRYLRRRARDLHDEVIKLLDESDKLLDAESKLLDAERKLLDAKNKLLLERLPRAASTTRQSSDWSGLPFYSTYLAQELGMTSPHHQYVLCFITAAGMAYGGRQMYRACLLMKAVKQTDSFRRLELMHRAKADEQQLARAGWFAQSFAVQGISAAIAAPVLWLAWRMTHRHGIRP
jgi:hypothetical protein